MTEDNRQPKRHYKLPEELLERCRELRRDATTPERLLWYFLRNRRLLGYKFRRQYPAGSYIIDFYCHEAKLGIELDGGGHLEDAQAAYDALRTESLADSGIKVIRFWNNQVLQETEAVLEEIANALQERTSKSV